MREIFTMKRFEQRKQKMYMNTKECKAFHISKCLFKDLFYVTRKTRKAATAFVISCRLAKYYQFF